MKTNIDLITDIRRYVQKLPAKVDMKPYVSVEKIEQRIRIYYMDSSLDQLGTSDYNF